MVTIDCSGSESGNSSLLSIASLVQHRGRPVCLQQWRASVASLVWRFFGALPIPDQTLPHTPSPVSDPCLLPLLPECDRSALWIIARQYL